jgi:hypothetical protein
MTDLTPAPKKTQTTFKSNTTHVARAATADTPGLLTDISRTAASRILDGDKLGTVNDGGESGNYKAGHLNIAPKPAFGMNSERQKNANTSGAAQVLSEAIQSGSTRLKP